MGLYFVAVLTRSIIILGGQVGGRVQNQPDPKWGALPELLQQDLCWLGLLHHQQQHGEPEAQQPAVWAPSECCWVFSWWLPYQQGCALGGHFAACGEARGGGPGCIWCLASFLFVVFKSFFSENSFLELMALGPSLELVNWGWEGVGDTTMSGRG